MEDISVTNQQQADKNPNTSTQKNNVLVPSMDIVYKKLQWTEIQNLLHFRTNHGWIYFLEDLLYHSEKHNGCKDGSECKFLRARIDLCDRNRLGPFDLLNYEEFIQSVSYSITNTLSKYKLSILDNILSVRSGGNLEKVTELRRVISDAKNQSRIIGKSGEYSASDKINGYERQRDRETLLSTSNARSPLADTVFVRDIRNRQEQYDSSDRMYDDRSERYRRPYDDRRERYREELDEITREYKHLNNSFQEQQSYISHLQDECAKLRDRNVLLEAELTRKTLVTSEVISMLVQCHNLLSR